jgi:hypothetical protein
MSLPPPLYVLVKSFLSMSQHLAQVNKLHTVTAAAVLFDTYKDSINPYVAKLLMWRKTVVKHITEYEMPWHAYCVWYFKDLFSVQRKSAKGYLSLQERTNQRNPQISHSNASEEQKVNEVGFGGIYVQLKSMHAEYFELCCKFDCLFLFTTWFPGCLGPVPIGPEH